MFDNIGHTVQVTKQNKNKEKVKHTHTDIRRTESEDRAERDRE